MNEPEGKEVKDVKRDANADLALCVNVPAGPYKVELDVVGAPCEDDERADRGGCLECDEFGACEIAVMGHTIKMASALESNATYQPHHRIEYDHGADPRGGKGEREQFTEAAAIAAFIAMGPEPLRYWIVRALAAEANVAALHQPR